MSQTEITVAIDGIEIDREFLEKLRDYYRGETYTESNFSPEIEEAIERSIGARFRDDDVLEFLKEHDPVNVLDRLIGFIERGYALENIPPENLRDALVGLRSARGKLRQGQLMAFNNLQRSGS